VKDIPAETIIFKPTKPPSKEESNSNLSVVKDLHSKYEKMVVLIKAMIQGQNLANYIIDNAFDDENLKDMSPDLLTVQKISTYRGISIIGEIYQLKNNSDNQLILREQDFYNSNKIKMILLGDRELTAGEETHLYVVRDV
jgi:hypothetical protein